MHTILIHDLLRSVLAKQHEDVQLGFSAADSCGYVDLLAPVSPCDVLGFGSHGQ